MPSPPYHGPRVTGYELLPKRLPQTAAPRMARQPPAACVPSGKMPVMEQSERELEARFRAVQDSLPSHVRVARATAMFSWNRDLIGREIVARTGPMSDDRLKWEIAMRMYGSDAACRTLIQRMLDHVSD